MASKVLRFPVARSGSADTDTGAADGSFESYCEISFARRVDLAAYQRCFPDRAARYFRATGLNAAELAVAYGVNARTAQNWLEGIVAPRADKIAVIALRDPAGFVRHFGEDAA